MKKKFINSFIALIIIYIIGVTVSMVTGESQTITQALSGTYTFIIFGVGLLGIILYISSKDKTYTNDDEGFTGKTQSGTQMNQHYEARFVTEQELLTNPVFMPTTFRQLPKVKKSGVMIRSLYKHGQMYINMYNPIHTLIIGTTGSGKTTFILDPAIRVYAHTAEKPCMVITDPKGELYNNHSIQLREEGYRIITIDLRNPYSSTRWNPMEHSFNMYQRAHKLESEVRVYRGASPKNVKGFKVISNHYGDEWYGFNGIAYPTKEALTQDLEAKKQSLINEAENELREIASTIVTIESKTDQGWERGAQDFLYGLMLAMLEDSQYPELGMTKDKFNFYNLVKIATYRDTDGDNMMKTLQQYTSGRDMLSKVPALTSTVVNNAPNTTRSYLGVLQPKIAVFQDMGICYCTSGTDISFEDFTDQPTVLFIKVPDEKESRHAIATMCISQLYKTLIETASQKPNLQLPRPVYFLLDEFANLPKIEKMDTIITVARSRRIFFELVIQSYSQLDNKYTKEVADTIKGNCNIQIFIGTEDQKTREEFSKICGEVTLKTKNVSQNQSEKSDKDTTKTIGTQIVTRPLIEPYELGQLPYDVNIVKIYGQPPIKTQMTQYFKNPALDQRKAAEEYAPSKHLDERAIFYDIKKRNSKIFKKTSIFDDFDFWFNLIKISQYERFFLKKY